MRYLICLTLLVSTSCITYTSFPIAAENAAAKKCEKLCECNGGVESFRLRLECERPVEKQCLASMAFCECKNDASFLLDDGVYWSGK